MKKAELDKQFSQTAIDVKQTPQLVFLHSKAQSVSVNFTTLEWNVIASLTRGQTDTEPNLVFHYDYCWCLRTHPRQSGKKAWADLKLVTVDNVTWQMTLQIKLIDRLQYCSCLSIWKERKFQTNAAVWKVCVNHMQPGWILGTIFRVLAATLICREHIKSPVVIHWKLVTFWMYVSFHKLWLQPYLKQHRKICCTIVYIFVTSLATRINKFWTRLPLTN